MLQILQQKVSPAVAYLLIIVFGFACVVWMNGVFMDFAQNEIIMQDYSHFLAEK